MKKYIPFLVLLLWTLGSCSSLPSWYSNNFDPPDSGLTRIQTVLEDGTISSAYYIPRATGTNRKLLIWLGGSGYKSILGIKKGGTWLTAGEGWMISRFGPKGYDFLIPEKPNVLPGQDGSRSQPVLQASTVETRASSYAAAIREFLKTQGFSKVFLVGASEGGDLIPKVYHLIKKEVPVHGLGIISSGAMPQGEQFRILEQRRAAIKDPEYLKGLQEIIRVENSLSEHQDNTSDFIFGHPLRRWASFLSYDPLPELLEVGIPIFLYHGREDTATPVEASQRVAQAFQFQGKTNLTYVEVPGGHSAIASDIPRLTSWLDSY